VELVAITKDEAAGGLSQAPWYQEAVIYEVNVRGFYDSNGDGIGDFSGLAQKLDYVQSLGMTALWLLPFCHSPWRDDGYDISDYTGVHPAYGCIDDFRVFVSECKRRNLRVITELVLNHTSDVHPWFERARRSPPDSRWRDFYVWSPTPRRYCETRVIFKDFEKSNWTWDPIANAYYWHRFYSHQPDLNYDNPLVREAIFEIVDFWLGLGVDGLRLDAVPYLYEREGTTCENLPETHAFLRSLRRHVDSHYTDRVLIAEANQWPEDAVAYFGQGDECHMAFHFPLMPRLFMAIRTEDAFPVINIIGETPDVPPSCQWATFLRNHDELTLEMVSEDDRDYMYRMYAKDTEMRINLGIRRRLAPLVENDRRRIELLNALLLSLPGTPVIYYGDEIGMGDNFTLGDRNGVRTPMQWNSGKNAGFSEADPDSLYLPVISEGEYSYAAVNVELQEQSCSSLLSWMRQAIGIRCASPALAHGTIHMLTSDNRHVLAFLRRTDEELVLVLANLSRLAQTVKVQLDDYTGFTPIELFGHVAFSQINAASTSWMLPPYGFYWFRLRSPKTTGRQPLELPAVKVSTINSVLDWDHRTVLGEIVLEYLRKQSHARARSMTYAEVIDIVKFGSMSALIIIRLSFTAGEPELQLLPLNVAPTQERGRMTDNAGEVLTALLTETGDRGVLYMGHNDGAIGNGLIQLIATETSVVTHTGSLQGQAASVVTRSPVAERVCLIPCAGRDFEQRNASVRMSDRFVIKLFRHLEAGPHPDFELPRFLHDHAGFCNVAPPIGTVYYVYGESEPITAAVLYSYVDSRHDLWQLTLDELLLFLDRASIHSSGAMTGSHNVGNDPSDLLELYLERMRVLGRRSAEMHLALGSATEWPDFAPEIFDPFFARGEIHAMNEMVRRLLIEFEATLPALPPGCRNLFRTLSEQESNLRNIFERLASVQSLGHRIRIHGDFHLGQVLETRDDVVFIDFEGDSTQPLARRVMKRSPLLDVAGMEFSLQYAVAASTRPERWAQTKRAECARSWSLRARASFRDEYLRTMNGSNLLPRAANDFKMCLTVYLVAKAVYQVAYELENRPSWVPIAVQTLLDLIAETLRVETIAPQTSQ
jgi:maltose alpha-D-glucosyltransferase / alpha-amylase